MLLLLLSDDSEVGILSRWVAKSEVWKPNWFTSMSTTILWTSTSAGGVCRGIQYGAITWGSWLQNSGYCVQQLLCGLSMSVGSCWQKQCRILLWELWKAWKRSVHFPTLTTGGVVAATAASAFCDWNNRNRRFEPTITMFTIFFCIWSWQGDHYIQLSLSLMFIALTYLQFLYFMYIIAQMF